jgi:dTDP-4-dehydrorhamnose 3,5-epimerase-like enzyme
VVIWCKHDYNTINEGRIPHDDPTIGYDGTAGPAIK